MDRTIETDPKEANPRTPGASPRKKRQTFIFQILIAIGLLAAVWFSFGHNVLSPQTPGGPPKKFLEMELASVVEGKQALAQVNELHGTDLGLGTAYIAEYSHAFNPYHGSNNEKLTVWVGKAENSQAAAALLNRMRQGIEKGGSPFSKPEQITVAGQEIFHVDGPNSETNFFYHSPVKGEDVVWLTIMSSSDPRAILEEALKTF